MKILVHDSAEHELLGYKVCKHLVIEDTANSFIKLLYQFTITPDMYESTVDPFKCPKSVLSVSLSCNHSGRYEAVSHCGFKKKKIIGV